MRLGVYHIPPLASGQLTATYTTKMSVCADRAGAVILTRMPLMHRYGARWQGIEEIDMEPWICPRCGTVNAPWRAQCSCVPTATARPSMTVIPGVPYICRCGEKDSRSTGGWVRCPVHDRDRFIQCD